MREIIMLLLFCSVVCQTTGCSQPDTSKEAPAVLRGVLYVDMYAPAYSTQRPLLCGDGRLFPEGTELVFRDPDTSVEFHTVFPEGVKAPEGPDLAKSLVLRGRFDAIDLPRDQYPKEHPPGYKYFVVSGWDYAN